MCRFTQTQAVNDINAFILWWVCIGLITLGIFFSFISFLFSNAFIMRFHGVNLLCRVAKIDGLRVLVVSGAGSLVLVWMLRVALLGVFFKYFTLFQRLPGAMQHACIFSNDWRITWMACIVYLALARADLLGIGWRGGCSSIFIPVITGTDGFWLLSIFGSCYSFVDCLRDFHALKHITCILIGSSFKIPSLYVGLFCPQVRDSVKENIVQLFRVYFHGGAWSRENQKVVIQFYQLCGKSTEQDISRFLHCVSHCVFLLLSALMGGKYPSKPSFMKLIRPLVVIPTWPDRTSNYLRYSPCNVVRRKWILPVADLVPVPSVAVLKSFLIHRNSSSFPFSNVATFRL